MIPRPARRGHDGPRTEEYALALAISLLALGAVYVWVSMSGATTHRIQIDYTWASQLLDSAQVEIDGEVVGILQRYGRSSFVTSFEVEPGMHVVRVLRDGYEGRPDTLTLGGRDGRLASFIADVDDGLRCRVLLR